MKYAVILAIVVAILAGVKFHFITFDPVGVVTLVVLVFTQASALARQSELATLIKDSHKVTVANQRAILTKVETVAADVKRIKNG